MRVTTVAGTSVASKIDLRIVSGRMTVARAGEVWLKKGYDHWCGSIGGEASLFNAVPHGKRLEFRAIVTANGGTVTRDWPIVVR